MPKSSAEFWNENISQGEEFRGKDREKDFDCDCSSAKALKKILSLLDELNTSDLRLLDEVIDRILCERRH